MLSSVEAMKLSNIDKYSRFSYLCLKHGIRPIEKKIINGHTYFFWNKEQVEQLKTFNNDLIAIKSGAL